MTETSLASARDSSASSWPEAIWFFLVSMKTAVTLLLVLAVACFIGAWVQQGQPREAYYQDYGRALAPLVLWLGINHVFTTWWFIGLLVLVSLSLFACSVHRLRLIWHRSFAPVVETDRARVLAMRHRLEWKTRGAIEEAADSLSRKLRASGLSVRTVNAGEGISLFAQRGAVHNWGALFAHLSLLVIFIGGVYGHLPTLKLGSATLWRTRAYEANAPVAEGDQPYTVRLPEGRSFQVALRKAHQDLNAQGEVEDFRSDITIYAPGRPLRDETVRMNGPVYQYGVSVVMSSYDASYAVEATNRDGKKLEIPVEFDAMPGGHKRLLPMESKATLPDTGETALLFQFSENGRLENGRARAPAGGERGYATANLVVIGKGHMGQFSYDGWLSERQPASYHGWSFRLVKRTWALLSLRRDSGMPVVWVGFGLMMVGMVLAFYVTNRVVRVRVEPAERPGQAQVAAGVVLRGPAGGAEKILSALRDSSAGENS